MTTSTLKMAVSDFCYGSGDCSECLLHIYGGAVEDGDCPAKNLLDLLDFTNDRIYASGGNPGVIGTKQDTVTIHTYYRQHDVYKIPRTAWEQKLAACGGDTDAAVQIFIGRGVAPADGDTTEFYVEAEEN